MSILNGAAESKLDARHQAFMYQIQAFEAVKNLEYSAIFHEQGLGKTKIGIDLALHWLKSEVVDSVIIVTKRGLIENWTDELATHTFLKPRIIQQDRRANFYAFNSPARVYLCHYEVFKSELERLKLFQQTRKLGVILDESQKIKNPEADLTKAFFALSSGFVRRSIMTGTPIANRPFDLWSQIYFLDHGTSLGSSFSDFSDNLELKNSLAGDHDGQARFQAELGTLFGRIRDFTVRETKLSAGIDLPEKHIQNLYVDLDYNQRAFYEQIKLHLKADVEKDGVIIEENAEDILKRLLRLVQIASNPRLVDDSYLFIPSKYELLENLLQQADLAGEKTIIWTNFIGTADWLTIALKNRGTVVLHGRKSMEQRNAAIAEFKSNNSCRVLVATPASAKEGLTLTVANRAIFFDRSFSLDDYLQAQDRIHRISQNSECFVYNLIARDTVDEWVDMLLSAKQLAAQLAQGDIDESTYAGSVNYDFGRVVREILALGGAKS